MFSIADANIIARFHPRRHCLLFVGLHRYVFKPIWNYVAMHMALEDPKGKRKLVMASFNCEQVREVPWWH